jgi:hypothetical protein
MDATQVISIGIFVLSGIGSLALIMLGVIAYYFKRDRSMIDLKFQSQTVKNGKTDEKFEKMQKEIHELAESSKKQIAVIETNVTNNSKLIDMMSKRRK